MTEAGVKCQLDSDSEKNAPGRATVVPHPACIRHTVQI